MKQIKFFKGSDLEYLEPEVNRFLREHKILDIQKLQIICDQIGSLSNTYYVLAIVYEFDGKAEVASK